MSTLVETPKVPDTVQPAVQIPQEQVASESQKQPAMEYKKQASKGEKLYEWLVYKGLNYWVNLGSSILIADYFRNLGGKKLLEKGAKMLSGGNEKVFNQVHPLLKTLTLLSGGWLLVIPVKLLEDNKRSLVHKFNEKLGVDQTAPDGHKETADEIYIENEQPKQSWMRVLGRRLMATGAVLSSGFVINHAFKEKGAAKPNGEDILTEKIVNFVNKGLKKLPGGDKMTQAGSTAQRWLSFAALDAGYTKITEIIMHITNGAKKAKMPQEIGDDAPAGSDKTLDQITIDQQAAETRAAPVPVPQTEVTGKQETEAKEAFDPKAKTWRKDESCRPCSKMHKPKAIIPAENFVDAATRDSGLTIPAR